MKQPFFRDNQIPFVQDLQKKNEKLKELIQIEKDKNNSPLHCCKITNEKWLNDLTEENETLKNKVKHLEQMIEILDTVCKTYEPNFESFDHKTIRNQNGNLITYYTK